MPNWVSKQRVLAISFEAVTSGVAREKARGFKGRILSHSRWFGRLLMFGYKLAPHDPLSMCSDKQSGSFSARQKMFVQMYTEARSRYHSCRREVFHIMTMCTLVIQHATCMRHFIPSSVALSAVLYFSTLPHKRQDLGGGGDIYIEHIISTTFVGNISYSKKNGGRNYHKYTYKLLTGDYNAYFCCYIIC
jgi:hypothetical protein